MERIQEFLKYIYRNNITIRFDYYHRENQKNSVNEFIKLLKEIAGD